MTEGDIDIGWLESVMKNKGYDVSQLLAYKVAPAVGEGENYVSELNRLSLVALSTSGSEKQLSVIRKRKTEVETENERLKYSMDQAFAVEYHVYGEILPKFEKYLPGNEKLWADCLALVSQKEIYFEDLKDSGYQVSTRLTGLDNQHCCILFENIAKLHAASYMAINNGDIDPTSFKEYLVVGAVRSATKIKSNSYAMMIDVIRRDWPPEWSSLADRLEKICSDLPARVEQIGKYNLSRINVFNHGDLWVNNIMYAYDDTGKPTSIKFVDFQIFHYNSYGLDLCYFLNTSVDSETKRQHLHQWIDIYCETFSKCLRDLGSPLVSPTPDMVMTEITRLTPFSLNICLRLRPIIMVPAEDSIPLSEVWKDTGFDSRKRKLFTNPNYTEVAKRDIPDLLNILEK